MKSVLKMDTDKIETIGLGAGQNPIPEEPSEKCYQFDFNASISGFGIVYARTKAEAEYLIENNNYDDIIDTFDMEIQEITNIEEE